MSDGPVALVTAIAARDLDEDLAPLAEALDRIGIGNEIAAWDDDAVDWSRFSLAVVRSTWDYIKRLDDFLDWIDRVDPQTALFNPPSVLRWNTDKRYLRDLAREGVAVVETRWLAPGDTVTDDALAFGDRDTVVKPTVSAGSKDTARYAPTEQAAAAAHAGALLDAGRAVMVQPYLSGVDEHGETAAAYVDGEFSHGLRKGPLLERGDAFVESLYAIEEMSSREPAAAERALAGTALAAVARIVPESGTLLYSRVDMVPGPDGAPVVLELELTEPSMFHAYAPGSEDTFAAAIARRLHFSGRARQNRRPWPIE